MESKRNFAFRYNGIIHRNRNGIIEYKTKRENDKDRIQIRGLAIQGF